MTEGEALDDFRFTGMATRERQVFASMTRGLSLVTQIFKPLQAETARTYLVFALAWRNAAAGDRRRTRFYANADSASRTSIFVTLPPSLTPAAAIAA
jgi:hypothetical protein